MSRDYRKSYTRGSLYTRSAVMSSVIASGPKVPRDGLLAWLRGDVIELSPGVNGLRDSNRSNSAYRPEKGRGYQAAGGEELQFAHLTGSETVVSKNGTATVTPAAGKLTLGAGTLWGWVVLSDGTKFCCAEGKGTAGTNAAIINVADTSKNGVISGATLSTFHAEWVDGTGFNHNTFGFTKASGHPTLAAGVIIPYNPANPSKDAYGNSVSPVALDADLYGYTGTWDGVAYATLATPVTLSGDCKIEVGINYTITGIHQTPIGSNSLVEGIFHINDLNIPRFYVNSTAPSPALTVPNGFSVISAERVGSTVIYRVGDNEETKPGMATNDVILRYIGKWGTGGGVQLLTSPVMFIKLYNAAGTLIHHWVCQNGPTKLGTKIYDIVGGNHATLVGATLPFFTTASRYATHLIVNGYTETATALIPAKANGTDALNGLPITTLPGLRSTNAGYFLLPPDAGLIANDPSDTMFTAGTANPLNYSTMDAWTDNRVNDQAWLLERLGQFAVYPEAQTGTPLARLNKLAAEVA